jgi:hypothetical protein
MVALAEEVGLQPFKSRIYNYVLLAWLNNSFFSHAKIYEEIQKKTFDVCFG